MPTGGPAWRSSPLCQLKGNWFDADLLVSPLQADCETRFRFTADGRVQAAQDADNAAAETGSRLGLNISKLRRLRAGAIAAFVDNLPNSTDEDLRTLVVDLMRRDTDGRFPEFCLPIVFVLRGLIPP